MRSPGNHPPSRSLTWLLQGPNSILKVQVAVAFIIITLLNTGYYWQRELRALAIREHVQYVVNLWDGFEWYTWLLAVPAALLLIRRYPLARGRLARNLSGLVLGSLGIYLVVVNARYLLRMVPNLWRPDALDLPWDWMVYLHTQLTLAPIDFLTYGVIFASAFAIDYYVQFRQRAHEAHQLALRASQLQSELASAQLSFLRGQLQPHFLFNAFNAIATLVRLQKNDLAVEMIAQLSALLRLTMEDTGLVEVPLQREVDFVMHYLAVERIRFGDKLQVAIDVPADAQSVLVPKLLLQPLAGNAVKHAISRRITPGTIRISARHAAGRLHLEVTDDGPGPSPGPPPSIRTGVGLANTRARLEAAYQSDFRMELRPAADGGMIAHLDLPWRPAPAAAEPAPTPA